VSQAPSGATITDAVEAFLTKEPDPLIKRGRYQIVPADGEKAKPHTRITNFAKKLEDEYNLTKWKQRMVLLGAAQRSDITIAALANSDDKAELDRLADAAMDAAKANVSRETGTALHRICERIDQGEDLDLPEPWRSDAAAYTKALADLGATVELIEEVVVVPRLALAGRLDRTVLIGDTRYICDLKTGENLSYSWGSIAIQLALYAGAETIYKPQTKKHQPMPDVSQDRALVVHLPAGKATAIPYWVNLEAGRRGIALVQEVLAWRRNSKDIASRDEQAFVAHPLVRTYTEARLRYVIDAGHGAELAASWPAGVPTLKESPNHTEPQLDLLVFVCSEIEARHGLAFPDIEDPRDA
jgi:hypothetical protein